MKIKTSRLTLRPFLLSDLITTHEYACDPDNTRFMIHLPNNSIDETEQFLISVISEMEKEPQKIYEFAVCLGDTHIGAVSARLDESEKVVELGWIINKKYHNNGYATEAAKAVMDFAVNKLGIKKIVAHCDYRNTPSIRVMEKLGMSLENDKLVRRYKGSEIDVTEFMYSLVINT